MSRPALARWSIALAAAATLGACTPDAYRRDADRQVYRLIKDRENKTVGYEPQVDASTTTQPVVPKKAYDRLPLSPLPPDGNAAIEPSRQGLPYAGLGPEDLFDTPLPKLNVDVAGTTTDRARLRLSYGPPAELGTSQSLGLFDTIGYGVQHSREYQSRMESLYNTALNVTLERHLFTPRPFVTSRLRYEGGQEDVGFRSALIATQQAGVRQRLPLGGEVAASALVSFVNALNDNTADGETAAIALTGSIPLLRGAGLINLEPLIQSERQVIYAVREFEDYRRQFAVTLASRYFRLLTGQQSLRNRYLNYQSFANLVEQTQALFAAGRVTALEVQRAQQSLLSAEDALNNAQQSLDNDLDDFKVVIGMSVDQPVEVVPVEVDVESPDLNAPDTVSRALAYRLDLQTARDRIDDARRGVANARNGLLPDLNIDLGTSIGNRADTPGRAIDSRTADYNAGLTLDLPVDRLAERNQYRRSLIDLERARRDAVELEERVLADVRASVRGILSAESSLEIQRQGIEIARRRLDFANQLLLTGKADNSRDSVEAQNSLLDAQDAYEQARADLQIQVLQYLRDSGTLRVDPAAGTLGLAMARGTDRPGSGPTADMPRTTTVE